MMIMWRVKVLMQMLVLMRLTVTVIESHFLLVRLSPTQLTVPFDSSLLEGAFAGVNIPLLFQTHTIPFKEMMRKVFQRK